ncbi:hypothetical protein HY78_00515 [Rhizorhabdus wittichii DC-6]|nr:hypothetical protein HY78_00515 [Rhizorhabdus wittichii DC-6]
MTDIVDATAALVAATGQLIGTKAQLLAWSVGEATGGPNGDGKYPFTAADNSTILVPCPAALVHLAQSNRGIFDTTAKALSNGVAGVTLAAAGSGGSDGTFALGFSGGGGGAGATGYFVVSGGKVVSVEITARGDSYTAAPALSFTASAGLTGASATAQISANVNVGEFFSTPGDASVSMKLYRVDAGPVAALIDSYPNASIVGTVAGVTAKVPDDTPVGFAWAVVDDAGNAAIGIRDDGTFAAEDIEVEKINGEPVPAISGLTEKFSDDAPVGFAWAMVDDAGNAAIGIKADGAFAAEEIEVERLNGRLAPGPGNRHGGAYPYRLGFLNNTGESLGEGSTGDPITTAQEYDNLCWPARTTTGGALLPSTVANGQYAARGENPMFGAQSGWKQAILHENGLTHQDNDFRLLACNNGYSGYKIAQISKGQAPFTAMMAQMTALAALAPAFRGSVGCLCNFLTIGANDGNPSSLTDTPTFKSGVNTFANDYDADARAITGQSRPIITILNQLSSRAPQLAVAMLELSHENPLIFIAGPMYQYSYYDTLHVDPPSERLMGALDGLVAKRVITDGVRWEPLQPVSHMLVGASIYLRFNKLGLTIDTGNVSEQDQFGFDCLDGAAATVAQSADPVIVGRDTIKLTFADEATASSVAKIRAGHNVSVGRSDSFAGGSTNLRCSLPLMIFDDAPIYDWCVIFSYSL